MEARSSAEVVVTGPDGAALGTVALSGRRVTVGRLRDVNDVALEPDPELLVTRSAHCTFEREDQRWTIVDGGSVNGTFVRRDKELRQVAGRMPLRSGDVVCVLASLSQTGERRFFELAFHEAQDSQATRAVAVPGGCLRYELDEARLVLVRGAERHEIQLRPQGHLLVRYMAARNAEAGSPALCTHDELMQAVWGDEPMHSREELAKLFWELRRRLEPLGAADLIESERRRGYRLRTCPSR
jgi:FHA domain-containing protein